MLVGLSYGGIAPEYGVLRDRDFKPRPAPQRGAAELYRYLMDTLRPQIESHYAIDTNASGLGGSSLGGLFTLYALYREPTAFSRYVAISPAAVWDEGSLTAMDAEYAKTHKTLPATVYVSHGEHEYAPFRDPIIAFKDQLKARQYQDLDLLLDTTPTVRHAGVKAIGFALGLHYVWRDMALPGPSGLELEMKGRRASEPQTKPE